MFFCKARLTTFYWVWNPPNAWRKTDKNGMWCSTPVQIYSHSDLHTMRCFISLLNTWKKITKLQTNVIVKVSIGWRSNEKQYSNEFKNDSDDTKEETFHCICVKTITLWKCISSSSPSSSHFFASRACDLGIVNRYSWFWKSPNMALQGSEFSFFQGIHVKINISISIRPTTTKFDKQIHLKELTKMRLFNQVLVTSSRHDLATN